MSSHNAGIGGLSHLVEAATALTKLDVPKSREDLPSVPSNILGNPRSVVSDDDEERKKQSSKSSSRSNREIFPQRLMTVLADTSLSDIVSWLPHGE